MHKVSITPQWTISDASGANLSPRLLGLLVDVAEHGSLLRSCKVTGCSYRHAWNLIRQGEAQLGRALLNMEKGKGSTLTPIAEKLVWASRRITARLSPLLETLASELEAELGQVIAGERQTLRVHASHGFAVEKLIDALVRGGHSTERKYVGSQEAVASLAAGQCDVAGFPVPLGDFEAMALAHYAQWLDPQQHRLIHFVTRRLGLMVAAGNPKHIQGLDDLTRADVRFVNRQPSSSTALLLGGLLGRAQIDPQRIQGFKQSEFTHAAVAACVASGMADVGLGVETPARYFKLDFLPVAEERYALLVHKDSLEQPHVQALLRVLSDPAFMAAIDELPGYQTERCGQIDTLTAAFPLLAGARRKLTRPARRT